MNSICGINCEECDLYNECRGCKKTNGCPFGKKCFIANYIDVGGKEKYLEFKNKLIEEINSLGYFKINELYALKGSFVNLEYILPNGKKIFFLEDDNIYLGNQIKIDNKLDICYGVVCNPNFILICTYEKDGKYPVLVLYKQR